MPFHVVLQLHQVKVLGNLTQKYISSSRRDSQHANKMSTDQSVLGNYSAWRCGDFHDVFAYLHNEDTCIYSITISYVQYFCKLTVKI